MNMDNIQQQIKEVTYLNTEKTLVYRPIMKFIYNRHAQANGHVYPYEVLEYLNSTGLFKGLTLDDINRDLEQLAAWGNLKFRLDPRSPLKVSEFLKNRYQYSISQISFGLEKTLEEFYSLHSRFNGSVDSSLTNRLLDALYSLKDYKMPRERDKKVNQEVHDLWEDISYRFESLRMDSVNYLAHIDYQKFQEEISKGEREFVIFKEEFVTYLQDFILSLYRTADVIISVIEEIEAKSFKKLVQAAAEHKCSRDKFVRNVAVEAQMQVFVDNWYYMNKWFTSSSNEHSGGYESLLKQTQETIDHILRFVRQISEKYRQVKNRQHEYLHAAKLFEKVDKDNIEKAHELYAYIFGVEKTRHIKANRISSEQLDLDNWDLDGEKITLLSKYRERKERKKQKAVKENKAEKERLLREYERRQAERRMQIESYLSSNPIRIRELGLVPPTVREQLLDWLNRCSFDLTSDTIIRNGYTDDGRTFRVTKVTEERIELVCEDGFLEMDDLEFYFEEVR
ncbi:TIGR02677 family protein [Mesobacillus foraminis]|uniref:TIGR02677 family protein n=1 Tax=Mesobacillus foraminis TaxID=279826 RepID=UPI001BEA97E0|nr:TIGR02677 family protein [Mesobacillus foraminis]MBT2759300.1 TIGR02677 family protein [Mesobacillus foraminis]